MEARGSKVFPRITNGKVYVPIGGELEDGTMVDELVELPPEDPSYEAIKAWLIQVELGEWALKGILPRLAMSTSESREQSIQSLKLSLPELSTEAFEKLHRQAFIRAHLGLLGYESRRGEGWDDILECLDAERQRRAALKVARDS
jgi:hypothetical protein